MKFTKFGFDAALESTLDDFETETAVLESFNNFTSLMDGDDMLLSNEIAMEGTGKLKENAQIFWKALKEFIAKAIFKIKDLLKKNDNGSSYKNVGGFIENFSKMIGQSQTIFQKANMMLAMVSSGNPVNLRPISEPLAEFMEIKAELYTGIKEADASKAKSASESQFKQFEKVCEQTTSALQKISGQVEAISNNAELASNHRVQADASSIVKMCTQVSNTLSECYLYGSKKCAEVA